MTAISDERPSRETSGELRLAAPAGGGVTAATPGTAAIVRASAAIAALDGGALTSASTPGLSSAPVARSIACCARADGEDGATKPLRAFRRPAAGPPYTPAAMKNTSVSTAIRRGWRRARSVNAVSTEQPFLRLIASRKLGYRDRPLDRIRPEPSAAAPTGAGLRSVKPGEIAVAQRQVAVREQSTDSSAAIATQLRPSVFAS